jgi:two-component sensor histidine kinase
MLKGVNVNRGHGVDRIPAIRQAILADRPPLAAFAWGALAVAVPTALRWMIDRGSEGVPFLTYFPTLTLAALFLGWRWAALVALVSAAVANNLFRDEPLRFWQSGSEAALAGLFVLSCAALVAIGEIARRTVREAEAAKARETMLNQELLHRVKNLLATVNAMAVLTARHSEADEFVPALTGRMLALERATELLGVGEHAPCELGHLVETALAPFRAGDNFMIAGPACELPRDSCVPLSLALHELCTNAAKYGALSVPKGWVSVDWALARDGLLTLSWREENGPRVAGAERAGMGTQLLRRQRGLDHVELHYNPAGVECTIAIEGCSGS